MSSQASELKALLERAQALAGALGDGPLSPLPLEQRPGFFAPESGNELGEVVDRLSKTDLPITFVLGAGASMEAGLPSWAALVRGLVKTTAPRLRKSEQDAWLEAIDDSGLLAAAATARALSSSGQRFRASLSKHLYGDEKPEDYQPGPLCTEVAAFKRAFFETTSLVTFNYDDLLERALQTADVRAEARIDDIDESPTVAVVRHLHGRLGPKYPDDPVVLTEADYARFPAEDTWQSRVMSRALDGLCVFVGLSFNDPNLLRWVYRGGDRRHLALFTRQSSPSLSPNVRRELERATRARLSEAGVDAYWADFYGELAQVVHEARRRGGQGRHPPFLTRAAQVSKRGQRRCTPPSTAFGRRQREMSELLSALLDIVQSIARSAGVDLADEHLGLALWGVDHVRREASLWASSDRLYSKPEDIVSVPFELASRWTAVEAATQSNTIEIDPLVYASRWRYVRGVPLVWGGDTDRIIVGAATLTSTTPAHESALAALAGADKREIDHYLSSRLVQLWR
jgi:hypothetical protein